MDELDRLSRSVVLDEVSDRPTSSDVPAARVCDPLPSAGVAGVWVGVGDVDGGRKGTPPVTPDMPAADISLIGLPPIMLFARLRRGERPQGVRLCRFGPDGSATTGNTGRDHAALGLGLGLIVCADGAA